jgi:hypothetical protein
MRPRLSLQKQIDNLVGRLVKLEEGKGQVPTVVGAKPVPTVKKEKVLVQTVPATITPVKVSPPQPPRPARRVRPSIFKR